MDVRYLGIYIIKSTIIKSTIWEKKTLLINLDQKPIKIEKGAI